MLRSTRCKESRGELPARQYRCRSCGQMFRVYGEQQQARARAYPVCGPCEQRHIRMARELATP